jgi:hypothetical protein
VPVCIKVSERSAYPPRPTQNDDDAAGSPVAQVVRGSFHVAVTLVKDEEPSEPLTVYPDQFELTTPDVPVPPAGVPAASATATETTQNTPALHNMATAFP